MSFFCRVARPKLSMILMLFCVTTYALAEQSAITSSPAAKLFAKQQFTDRDSLLVRRDSGEAVFQWRPEEALIPASLTKLFTANLAIKKWGLDHRFFTDFYLVKDQLWVRGYGDPYLISEEIELIAERINALLDERSAEIRSVHIDSTAIATEAVPGRTQVADPYNAPLSAVAANFNTVMLERRNGTVLSAETQTPLTPTGKKLSCGLPVKAAVKPTRINLVDTERAQQHFAELLSLKLNQARDDSNRWSINTIRINQVVPSNAQLVLRHENSRTLSDVLRGSLEYSNNFIANQVFLMLPEEQDGRQLSFDRSRTYIRRQLASIFTKPLPNFEDGAGLARSNRVSAVQLDQVLTELKPNKKLLKRYDLKSPQASTTSVRYAYAKTGTLKDVHSFAGFLTLGQNEYQFVFMFNRKTPYRYREQLLQLLSTQLAPN